MRVHIINYISKTVDAFLLLLNLNYCHFKKEVISADTDTDLNWVCFFCCENANILSWKR